MNLETSVAPNLWDAIRVSVEARNFSGAILDAMHVLGDVIRDRAGLESDGVALIGAAFGGSSPRLKVNRLQTESEQNVQRGVEALLRGLYQAVRNPRSHERRADSEEDAVAVILFIDFLLRLVDSTKSPFSLPEFVARILDADFVPLPRYAELWEPRPARAALASTWATEGWPFGPREDHQPPKFVPWHNEIATLAGQRL